MKNKKLKQIFVIVLGSAIIMTSLQLIQNINAEENTLENNNFVILDENGIPTTIDSTVKNSYSVKTYQRSRSIFSNDAMAVSSDYSIVRFKPVSNATYKYTEMDSGRTGYFNPNSAMDAAYIKTDGNFTICKMAGVKIKISNSYIDSIVPYQDTTNISYYSTDNGNLIHTFSYYNGSEITVASNRVGYQQSYMSNGQKYYSYDGHYFYKTFENMIDDYQSDSHSRAINANNPYYNYFQYLSMRTTSRYSGTQYNDYVKKVKSNAESAMKTTGNDFVNSQNNYYINSVIAFGVAINESGWGTSNYALTRNNLFGIKAYDSNPDLAKTFSSTQECINQWMYYYMQQKYLNSWHSNYYGPHLGDKQSGANVMYASDPYWGEKAAARSYYMDSKKSDYGRYTIGVSNSGLTTLYKEPNTSKYLYDTSIYGQSNDALYNYPVIILDTITSNGIKWYKVRSDMPLISDRNGLNITDTYETNRDYAYVKASTINIVFSGNGDISDGLAITLGDVNGDGAINAKDLLKIEKYIIDKNKNPLGTNEFKAADINNDGQVNSKDALKVERYIVYGTKI